MVTLLGLSIVHQEPTMIVRTRDLQLPKPNIKLE